MKKVRNIVAMAVALCLPGIGTTQGVNVGMPLGSSCPMGYHWDMAGGFAQCIVDPPPVPPVPPVASYTFIYRVTLITNGCNGNGCHTTTTVSRTTTSTGQWANLWQVNDASILPWGFDIGPIAASNPITYNSTDLRAFMGPFVNGNCVLASDNTDVKAIISGATGIDFSTLPYAPFAGQTLPNTNNGNPAATNYALCQTAIM